MHPAATAAAAPPAAHHGRARSHVVRVGVHGRVRVVGRRRVRVVDVHRVRGGVVVVPSLVHGRVPTAAAAAGGAWWGEGRSWLVR